MTEIEIRHDIDCPYCGAGFTVLSLMRVLILARRTCPNCRKDFSD
jgi:transposase-like protein